MERAKCERRINKVFSIIYSVLFDAGQYIGIITLSEAGSAVLPYCLRVCERQNDLGTSCDELAYARERHP